MTKNKPVIEEKIDQALAFEDEEEYTSSYDIWYELATEHNEPLAWEMLGNHLYSGKSYKSKAASLFCRIKALRAGNDEVFDDLFYIFKDNQLVIGQLNKIKRKLIEEQNVDGLIDQLEQLIYGDDKPTSLDEFTIV